MPKKKKKTNIEKIERGALKATAWIGSTKSLIVHTMVFTVALLLPLFGVPLDYVLLVLTTLVSLEAIYLAIFIQMTVNKNTDDIEEIQEDVEEIQEDVDEIQKDVDEIQEDIEEIEEDETDERKKEKMENDALRSIQQTLAKLSQEIEQMKKK